MQNSEVDLILRLQWIWGDSKIVKTSSHCFINDVLEREGFASISGHKLYVAYNGSLIDPMMTFHHYSVKNGSKLVITMKKIQTRERALKFLKSLEISNYPDDFVFVDQREENMKKIRREVLARQNDLFFSFWEQSPEYPTVMKEILTIQESLEENNMPQSKCKTDITPAKSIQEDPLHLEFHGRGDENEPYALYGKIEKGGIDFKSGIITDTRNGNSGICEKKH